MSSLRGTCLHRQMFARARACVCVLRAGVKRKEMCVDVKNKEARKRTHTRTHVHLLKKKSAQAIHACMHHTHTHTHTHLARHSLTAPLSSPHVATEQTKGKTRAPHLHSQCRTAHRRGGKGGGGAYLFVFKDTGTNTRSGVAGGACAMAVEVCKCVRGRLTSSCRCIDDARCNWQAAAQHQDFGTKNASSRADGQLDSSKPTNRQNV
jgi:hypothetical protein